MNVKLCILSLCLFTGFFVSAQSGTTVVDSFLYGGSWRSYRLYVPANYSPSKPAPLVANLHGLGSNAFQQQLYGNFMPIADTAGFLVLHPQGVSQGGTTFWNVGLLPVPDDVGFIRTLLDTVAAGFNVDADRTYCTGMSNGAIMSYYLACQLPGKFAAIASVAGTMFRNWYATCRPAYALPVMEIHGDNDMTVPYTGDATPNGSFMAIDTVIQKWRIHNQCPTNPQIFSFPDLNTSDQSYAISYRYAGGRDQSSVELIKVFNGGHAWPGAPAVLMGTNLDFSASKEIWRFFSRYRKSQFVTPTGTSGLTRTEQETAFTVFPNPVTNRLFVEAYGDVKILLFSGQGVFVQALQAGFNDLSALQSGLYYVDLEQNGRHFYQKVIKE